MSPCLTQAMNVMLLKIKRWFNNDVSSGVMLILAATLAMVLVNSPISQQTYLKLLHIPLEFRFGSLDISKNLLLWINDALMALFFLMVGLEVKHELMEGALASRERALFPFIAALGGMIVPGLLFLAFNGTDNIARNGWAIPTATDIAFASGILALLGKRVPQTLKIFLLALAIIDDIGAIIIIALFYTHDLSLFPLGVAAVMIVVLTLLNKAKVRSMAPYLLVGMVLWAAILNSGVHATLAGVIVGCFIPLTKNSTRSSAEQLVQCLRPWVNWLILPLFAFANAGVVLSGIAFSDMFSLLPLGIILGLLIGKPIGISLFCYLAVNLGWAKLPHNTTMTDIIAVSVLCGIGFTMSIFIATLAYGDTSPALLNLARLGILTGSVISAVAGYFLLRIRLKSV